MERLISNQSNEGLPYVNTDFNNVLQNQHIKAYTSFYDGVNDLPLTTSSDMNRGIIVKNLEVLSYNEETVETVLNLKDSLVYIPGYTQSGDLYGPNPELLETETYKISGETFYLFVDSGTFSTRTFFSGFNEEVLVHKYYTISSNLPNADIPGLDITIPHIKFNKGKTQRNLERIMNWNLSELGEIYISGDVSLNNFDLSTGLGVGDMFGFALCNGANGTQNLSGRMIINYDSTSLTSPADNTSTESPSYDSTGVVNYGQIGNIGGGRKSGSYYPTYVLLNSQMSYHNHGGRTTISPDNMDHRHLVSSGENAFFNYHNLGCRAMLDNSNASTDFGRGNQNLSSPAYTTELVYGPFGGDHLDYHTHPINFAGNAEPHETRPPYIVLAYYEKINPY